MNLIFEKNTRISNTRIPYCQTQESPIAKPIFDELDLTHIQQYLDGTVKISFQNNKPLRINEGRHSFAGSESISKRDQDLNDFLKKNFAKPPDFKSDKISKRDQDLNEFLEKNFDKPADLKLKGISNDKVSDVYYSTYSTKPESSSPNGRLTSEEEDDSNSVDLSERDFPPIDPSGYVKQLRVLTVLNEDFKINFKPDLIPLYDEFMLPKNKIKRNFKW